jgi:dipeptidyl aminopeptidase/acylaminoacyl peptidase
MKHVALALGVCLALAGGGARAQSVGAIPIEAFAEQELIRDPKLSPEGLRYAGMVSRDGKDYFAVLPVFPGKGEPVFIPQGDEYDVYSWSWVNDEWLVVSAFGSMNVYGYDLRTARAFGVSSKTGKVLSLAHREAGQNAADVVWIARDGSPRILLAVQHSVFQYGENFFPEIVQVDVSNGRVIPLVDPVGGVLDWYADPDGTIRVGVRYDDRQRTFSVLYRDKAGELFRSIAYVRTREDESLMVPLVVAGDSGKALVISDQDGFDALYELDLPSMKAGSKVFGRGGYDIGNVILSPAHDRVLGVGLSDPRPRVEWLDPDMRALQAGLDGALSTSGRTASITSFSRDSRRLLVKAQNASTPGTYFHFDRDTGVLTLLGHANARLRGDQLNPVTTIHYAARDGLNIPAVLTLPKGRQARKLPLIVLPHGGPRAQDVETWDWWAQALAQRGYAVVQPNYRGSTGYGTAFEMASYGQWGLAMQDDLLDAIDHLAAEGMVDPARVCIAGASYGGFAAMRAAQRDSGRYRCAISYAGVSDLADMLRYDRGFLSGGRRADYLHRSAPDFSAVSPLQHIEDFSTPILLMHGKRDRRVPVAQSRNLYAKLSRAGKTAEYIEQPLGDHYFSRTEDRLQFLREMLQFLDQYNPADP